MSRKQTIVFHSQLVCVDESPTSREYDDAYVHEYVHGNTQGVLSSTYHFETCFVIVGLKPFDVARLLLQLSSLFSELVLRSDSLAWGYKGSGSASARNGDSASSIGAAKVDAATVAVGMVLL